MNTEQINETIKKVDEYAKCVLSPSRYEHSVRVASLSQDLCERFALDGRSGYLAGIAHDICKSCKDRLMLSLVSRDGNPVNAIETAKPSLLHGRAAAVLLQSDFGVHDESVLEAIRNHTFGSAELDKLGMILFVADKIEPGREDYDPASRKRILESDLDGMTRLVLDDNIRFLELKGKQVSAVTLSMLERLGGRVKER